MHTRHRHRRDSLPRLRHAALIALVIGAPLAAQERIDHRWPLDADGMVRIYNFNGTVRITGWSRDSVVVTGTTEVFRGFFGGGTTKALKFGVEEAIKGPTPRSELTVFLPARARLWVRGASTDVEVRDVAGVVDVGVVSGRVRVSGSPAEVYAETMDGDLEVEASPSYFRGKTATGRLTWTGGGDDVTLATVSGAITVAGGRLLRARIESITGDIRYTGSLKPGANVTFDTHAGDVWLTLAKDTAGELSVDAPFGSVLGKIYKGQGGSPVLIALPRSGTVSLDQGVTITARSFKGRVVVVQQ